MESAVNASALPLLHRVARAGSQSHPERHQRQTEQQVPRQIRGAITTPSLVKRSRHRSIAAETPNVPKHLRSRGQGDAPEPAMPTNGRSFSADRFPPAHAAASLPPSRAPDVPAPPGGYLRHTRFRPARRRDRKPCQAPYDEGHSDLHSSTSSCVSVPDRRPSAINGGSRSSVQVRSAASNVT